MKAFLFKAFSIVLLAMATQTSVYARVNQDKIEAPDQNTTSQRDSIVEIPPPPVAPFRYMSEPVPQPTPLTVDLFYAVEQLVRRRDRSIPPTAISRRDYYTQACNASPSSDACALLAYSSPGPQFGPGVRPGLEQVCNENNALGCFFLGVMLVNSPERPQALESFERACQKNSSESCLALAVLHGTRP